MSLDSRHEQVVLYDPSPGVKLVSVAAPSIGLDDLRTAVADVRAGAIVTFEGVTREVDALRFEAYVPMAASQLTEICAEACRDHAALRVAVAHYIGDIPLGEPSVIVVASGAHREQAFSACRFIIDTLKERAPIWKVELAAGATHPVSGHVPQPPS